VNLLLVNVAGIVSGSKVLFGLSGPGNITPEAEKEDIERLRRCVFTVVEE
jgi:hypothetical protein